MNLAQIFIGAASIALGARAIQRGARDLSSGLRGAHARVERDPGPGGKAGKKLAHLKGPNGMSVELRSVGNLDERINAIRDRTRRGRVDPKVITWARSQVARKCPGRPGGWCTPEKDTEAEIKAIFHGLRRDVRYTSDVLGVDTYAHPRRTLEQRAGDCDDYSALGCASLMAIGIPCRFKVIRTKDSQTWNHIYIEAGTPKHDPRKWIPLDASVNVPPGWEVPRGSVAEMRIFEVT